MDTGHTKHSCEPGQLADTTGTKLSMSRGCRILVPPAHPTPTTSPARALAANPLPSGWGRGGPVLGPPLSPRGKTDRWRRLQLGSGWSVQTPLLSKAQSQCSELSVSLYVYFVNKDFSHLFLEREEGREEERERNTDVWERDIDGLASHTPPAGDPDCNPGLCPHWELNRQALALQAGTLSIIFKPSL